MSLTTDCTTQMRCSLLILTVLAEDYTHLSVRACIARISAKHFKEVVCRIYERIMELKVSETYKIALLIVLYLVRTTRTVYNLRKRLVVACILAWGIAQNRLAVSLVKIHCNLIWLICFIQFHSLHKRLVRRDCKNFFINLFTTLHKHYLHAFLYLCSVDSEKILTLALWFKVHCSKCVTCLHALDVTDTIIILSEFLHLIWLVPVIVRLVIRICTHHELNVVT